ncbi:MAG: polysaccharide biosynthesis C-terminal domain-containing protein, partial [Flavobacteriales bacterium]
LGGSGVVLAFKVLGALGGFLFSVWVARNLGDAALGRAELFILWVTVGATVLRGGWEGAVVKAFGAWTSHGMAERIRSAFRRWTGGMVGIGLLAGLAGSQVFGPDQGLSPSSWIGWGIGAWVVIGWLAECLRGTGHVSTYALFQPGWWMLLAGLLIAFGVDDPVMALVMSAVGMALVALVAAGWWFRHRFRTGPLSEPEPVVGMSRLALPIWIGSVLHLVLSWADTAMLSAWLTETDVAHYRAAFRLAALLTFTQFAVNALGAPTFGALHAAGDRAGLRRTVHRIGWLNTAVAVPGLLFLLALGPWLLSFWGPAFASAEAVTALGILAAAQALNALSGPVMYLLNMTGGERAGLLILALSAAVQVVLGVMLVPDHGLIGAALSAAIGMAVWNGVGLLWVRRVHGFWMVSLANGWWRRS